MIAAVMQPYMFPYVGYYQLAAAADRFVFLDDVTFIKQGWINRNQILVEDEPSMFTVPLDQAGSHVKIMDLRTHESYAHWRAKFLKTLAFNYSKAPNWVGVMQMLEEVMPAEGGDMCRMAIASVESVMTYVGLPFSGTRASSYALPAQLTGVAKVKQLCQILGADSYVNLPGGRDLYDPADFQSMGLRLGFLEPQLTPYAQGARPFSPGLSILDVLMFNTPREAAKLLANHSIAYPGE